MKGKISQLAAILLFLPLLAAQFEKPQLVSSASILMDENGTVTAIGGTIKDLEINVSIPVASAYQEVETQSAHKTDAEGNDYLSIRATNPANPFTYSEQISLSTTARTTPSLPASYDVPLSAARYLLPTSRTQSDNTMIRELAQQITDGASSPFEKAARLAIWVNQNMDYDEKMIGQERAADWVLQNRRGVCVEYSTIFVAMARSIGIPARYAIGYVYSEEFKTWMGHAWVEAYLGEWVPVDPTWFEVGALDALHIEAGKYAELARDPALLASVTPPSTQLRWETSGKSGAVASNIYVQSMQPSQPLSDFEFRVAEGKLAPGDTTIAFLSIKGTDYRVIEADLLPCTGEESISADGGAQFLILEPGKTTTAVWALHASKSIPGNYVYTCPLTLNSAVLEKRVINVDVDPRLHELAAYSAVLAKSSIAPGEQNAALISLPYTRQGKNYYLVAPDGVYQKKITTETGEIQFTARLLGPRKAYLAGEGGGFIALEYQSGANSSISISSLLLPEKIVAGKPSALSVNVSSASYPADVEVSVSFSGAVLKKSARIAGPGTFEFELLPQQVGSQTLTVSVSSAGKEMARQSAQLSVEKNPDAPANPPKNTQGKPPGSGVQSGGTSPSSPCPLALAILSMAFVSFAVKR